MAWRPTHVLMEGELDNTNPGKVMGWMRFAGMTNIVTFDLKGDFHRDIRGAKIHLAGEGRPDDPDAAKYMEGFAEHQTGTVGDITAGLPPCDYTRGLPYIEWYGEANGRVVIELDASQVQAIGQPIPWIESFPVSRQEQQANMARFLCDVAQAVNLPANQAVCVSEQSQAAQEVPVTAAAGQRRGMPLLTKELLRQLPPLGAQEAKGPEAIAPVKFFTPDNSWTWYAVSYSPEDGTFFGLVDGQFKELGYFTLAELETARGPLGMPIERDLHWQPRTLREIAPELFSGG
ncbi:MAG: DUF2958 domain-containing protein [Planctomycetota bacterium]